MTIWFAVIALLGLRGVSLHPAVLGALNPYVGLSYLFEHGTAGFLLLGERLMVNIGIVSAFAAFYFRFLGRP